jgi:glycosyltransferase involved in cell wall biosynthesis
MKIIFTVTNDLNYDQRMHRICGTLAANGHLVRLVGRTLPSSLPLEIKSFEQKRLSCFFKKGFLFYAEYNLRLFVYLLFGRYDAVCSIDLDTLPAGCLATLIRGKKRVFDAHEYFTEVPEVVNRPIVKAFWSGVARVCLPFYRYAYTVGPALAHLFEAKYGLRFEVIRNVPLKGIEAAKHPVVIKPELAPYTILYQGALNEGRGIETMLLAMQKLEKVQLVLAGEGDLSMVLRQMAQKYGLADRVIFLGYVKPEALKKLTNEAWLGLNLLENKGQSYFYSLANKFFDGVLAGVPVLTMDFPEYKALNGVYEVAHLIAALTPESVVSAIQLLQNDPAYYEKLKKNCLLASKEWNWEREQRTLLGIWKRVETSS